MSKGLFWSYYISHIEVGLFYGFLVVIINFFVLRKYIYSIFDPFFLALFMNSLAYSVVFFMYHLNLISDYYFYSFILTQTAFWIGFFMFKPINIKKIIKMSYFNHNDIKISLTVKYLYYVSLFLFVFSQLFVYYKVGIPLLKESRLEVYVGGSGFGFLRRVIEVSSVIVSVIAFYRIFFTNHKKLVDYFAILFILLVSILSGSKSTFLKLIFIMYFIVLFNYRFYFYKRKVFKKIIKLQWKLFLLAIFFAILVVFIQSYLKSGNSSFQSAVIRLLMRFVNTGDVYMLAYPNNFLASIKQIHGIESIEALFKDFFGMFRIIPWNELPKHLGLLLYQTIYKTDVIMGPNARHNVFGLYAFGFWGSIIFSFLLGIIVSFLRNKLYYIVPPTMLGMIIYIGLAWKSLSLEGDPPFALSYYNSFIIIFGFLYIISYILSVFSSRKRRK